ncbi:MAG TPA: radical SAM protein [Candidatus Pacearchaeota archaeon]|nr:radical SAM protein [Candidatus Pacearchaeota archaeon]
MHPVKVACILPNSQSTFRLINQPDYIKISNLLNIAARLQNIKIDVKIFDFLSAEGENYNSLMKQILHYNPEAFCICAHFCLEDLEIFLKDFPIGFLKKIFIICFGTGVIDYEKALSQLPMIDCVIPGFPENVVVDLLRKLKEKNLKLEEEIGVAFRKKGRIILKKKFSDDLDLALKDTPIHWWVSDKNPEMAYLWGSRGCWYRKCSFCNIGALSNAYVGNGWTARNIETVIKDIEKLKILGVSTIHFLDSEFIGAGKENQKRVQYFAKELIERNLQMKFIIDSRIDNIEYETFRLLKDAGLSNIAIGIESGSASVLKRLNKGYNLSEACKRIKILRDLRLKFKTNFILADPDSNIDEILESLLWIKEMQLLDTLKPFGVGSVFHPMHLHAGTPLYNQITKTYKKMKSETACIYHNETTRYFMEKVEAFNNSLEERFYSFRNLYYREPNLLSANVSYIKILGIHGLIKMLTVLKEGVTDENKIKVDQSINFLLSKYDDTWFSGRGEIVNGEKAGIIQLSKK